jgi:hypothetical protein
MEKRLIQYLGSSDSGDMVLLLHRSHFEEASSMVYPLLVTNEAMTEPTFEL